ncbi:hypothetical protein GJ496_008732 [Pomphorhynchus laevis]|nr:hypothetical protein GJ496_008732 [Pomphorhynchus laevis]
MKNLIANSAQFNQLIAKRRRQIISGQGDGLCPRPNDNMSMRDRYTPLREDQYISYNMYRWIKIRKPTLNSKISEKSLPRSIASDNSSEIHEHRKRPDVKTAIIKDPNNVLHDVSMLQNQHLSASQNNLTLPPPSARLCDFCLGSSENNPRTNKSEQLICCSECDRAAHPSCLQFDQKLLRAVALYPWQCMECKRCSICNLAGNDAQLLFCDRCDRGYHIYCLIPALAKPPDGEWHCELCLEQ